MTKILMLNSVDEHAAGTEIELPDELADLFIIKGYAEGQLSRDYDEGERAEALGLHQAVQTQGLDQAVDLGG